MIVPAIGSLTGTLGNASANVPTGQAGAAPGVGAAAEGGLGQASGTEGVGATGGGTPSFGSTLTEAISSLETSQTNASSASQALATGTVSDPEAAVATVEDAALEMQLAAQIRTKATEAAQTIFNTQV
jgi:flagellar hook-basal body complex protein FliE